jgi:hypothetical protein
MRLMRYHDGELDDAERVIAERHILRDPAARAELAGLSLLGDVLRLTADGRSLAAAPAPAAPRSGKPGGCGKDPPQRARRHGLVWSGALAAAAASALLLASTDARSPASAHLPVSRSTSVPACDEVPGADPVAGPDGASIELVDFGAHGGSIFVISSGAASTPVVWLPDEPQGSG